MSDWKVCVDVSRLFSAVVCGMLFLVSSPAMGQENRVLSLSGGCWVQVADDSEIAVPVFTVECWINVRSSGLIVTRDSQTGIPSDWQLWYEDRRLAFITAKSPPDAYFFTPGGSIIPGQWHHVALVVNGPDGYAELYIDGSLSIRPTFTPRYFDAQTGLAWGGYFNNASGAYLVGMIDEARFWTRARGREEIRATMNRRLFSGERDGLVGYWSFCEDLADSSGHGHDLSGSRVCPLVIDNGLPPALACAAGASMHWETAVLEQPACENDLPVRCAVTLTNAGGIPFTVLSVSIRDTSNTASTWDIAGTAPSPPSRIDPGGRIVVELSCTPGDRGVSGAMLLVAADAMTDTVRIPVECRYDGPLLDVTPDSVVLGTPVGGTGSATITLRNRSRAFPQRISDIRIEPPGIFSFTPAAPLTIAEGDSLPLSVSLNPGVQGRHVAQIIVDADGCVYDVTLSGSGCPSAGTVVLAVPDAATPPGERLLLPLLATPPDLGIVFAGSTVFGRVRSTCDALFPLFASRQDIVYENGEWSAPFSASWSGPADTLALLPFLAMLGTDTLCSLWIEVDSVLTPCPWIPVETLAEFRLTGICGAGGLRLFDDTPAVGLAPPHPNPGNGLVAFRFTTIEEGHTRLVLIDMLGRTVAVLHDAVTSAGTHSLAFDTGALASGAYILQLQTPSHVRARTVVISK